jgi:transcriptional regulator with XRE-family HTH domain
MVATPRTLTYGAAVHFGKQVKKERLAKHWSQRQFTAESGIDVSTASQIETGKLPPNERVARACDKVFPHREGWFLEYYFDSLVGIPPALRSWREHEDKAVRLDVWCPGNVHGLFQTKAYAEALLRTSVGRPRNRYRPGSPHAWREESA